MTEPTRDALHAATLAWLAAYDQQTTRTDEQQCLAYAAECVTRVPELEAEVERLRERFKRYADHDEGCPSYDRQPCDCGFPEAWYATFPEDAAATREGTDNG